MLVFDVDLKIECTFSTIRDWNEDNFVVCLTEESEQEPATNSGNYITGASSGRISESDAIEIFNKAIE